MFIEQDPERWYWWLLPWKWRSQWRLWRQRRWSRKHPIKFEKFTMPMIKAPLGLPSLTGSIVGDRLNMKELTCWDCDQNKTCKCAWDMYNTSGDCLANK